MNILKFLNKSLRTRRGKVLFTLASLAVLIGTLIYLEQIAILYVLSTLALVALLITVAMSDLENIGTSSNRGSSLKEPGPAPEV